MPHLALTLERASTAVGFAATGTTWPCHASVMQSFEVAAEVAEVAAVVRARTAGLGPVTVTGDHVEGFGPDRDIPVTVLREDDAVVALHEALLADLGALPGFAPEEPAWAGAGFRAHVTAGAWGSLGEGDAVVFHRVAVLALDTPDGRPAVVAAVPLVAPA